jgi:hypothetical protein
MCSLQVHKIENFFVSNFGICVISLLVLSKYYYKKKIDWAIIGGGTIFPYSQIKLNSIPLSLRLSGKIVSPPIMA